MTVMDQEWKSMLIRNGKGDLVKSMLAQKHLTDYLLANPLDPDEDMDLNPHLHVDYICDRICERMSNEENISVTKQEVMLLWLTLNIYSPHLFAYTHEGSRTL